MTTQIKDLSVDEFQHIITETTQNTMQEFFDDIQALVNPEYLKSIEEARADIRNNKFVSLIELSKYH